MVKKIIEFLERMFSFSFLNKGGGKRKAEIKPDTSTFFLDHEEILPFKKRKIRLMRRRLTKRQIKHVQRFGWSTIIDNLAKLKMSESKV